MSRTKAYLRGLTSTTTQKVLAKSIGLIVTPIIISYLGSDQYGIWVVIGSFLGYMGLMDLGITGSVTQMIAKSDNQAKIAQINAIVNNSFFLQVLIGFIIIVLGVVLSFFFPDWFHVTPESRETVWLAFLLASIGYGISFPPKTLKGLIRGRQQIATTVWLEFALFILTTGLNLWLLDLGYGLMALPIGTIILRLLSYMVFYKMAKKAFPPLRLDFRLFRFSEAKNILGVSVVWFVGAMSAVVIYTSDTIIIGSVVGTGLVATYVLTFRLSEFARELIYTINSTAMPGLGQLAGEGEVDKIRSTFLISFPVVMNMTFASALFIIHFNENFVSVWVGKALYGGNELSLVFAVTLLTTVVFHSFSVILSSGLNVKVIAISRVTEALLNVGLSLWLVQSLGILGVALGTVLASVMTSFWVVPYTAMKYMQLTFSEGVQHFGRTIVLPGFLFFGLSLGIGEMADIDLYLALIIHFLTSILLIWTFGLPQGWKQKILCKTRRCSE